MWYVYYVQSSKYNLNVNITFKYLKLICIAMVQLHMLLKVTPIMNKKICMIMKVLM